MSELLWYVVGFLRLINGKYIRYNQVLSNKSIDKLEKDSDVRIVGKVLFQIGKTRINDADTKPLPF